MEFTGASVSALFTFKVFYPGKFLACF